MPLTDDDFVKTGKLEGYSEMIQKLHEEEQTQPEHGFPPPKQY